MRTIIWSYLDKKGELFMLQILQTGKMLYVLAAICALGILSKIVTGSFYKRLIKETGNMALTKEKNLKGLKQRTENMFLLNQGIRNAAAYVEKQIYGIRFLNLSLDGWDNLSVQAMILCFLVGGASAFGAYWYRCDSYYIVLYGTMGILAGLLLAFADNGANIEVKRQQLADCLVDYVENSPHFYKNVDKSPDAPDAEKKNKTVGAASRARIREIGRKDIRAEEETAAVEETAPDQENEEPQGRKSRFQIEPAGQDKAGPAENARGERSGGKISVLKRKEEKTETRRQEKALPVSGQPATADEDGDELAKSIEQLRISLEQIAAGREQRKRDLIDFRRTSVSGQARRELKPEDIRLLGEILQDCFGQDPG